MNSDPNPIRRRSALQFALASLAGGSAFMASPSGWAQDKFPSRPLRITVPFPAGASNDYVARIVGQKMAETLGVPVLVDNKTGASGNIGADFVAKSPADGYNLLIGAVTLVTSPTLYERPAYVPDQLVPLGVGVDSQLLLLVRPGFPAQDIQSLIKAAATRPGAVNMASPGVATLPHLGMELLAIESKVQFNHIPYRGSAPALADVMGGQADVLIDSVVSALPMVQAGKLQAIATLTPQRIAALPNLPTAAEQGFRSLEFSAWNAFLAPAATSPAIVQALHNALAQAIQVPEVAKALRERGLEPVVQSPAAYQDFLHKETLRWSKVIKDAKVKIG